ncbi:hypothetical protein ACJXDE_05535 [Enterococcus faecium]|uniref:hypothetical protein n=1 Tax=Enterococcus faecium TaxID=1352 RepID=UPI0038D37E41
MTFVLIGAKTGKVYLVENDKSDLLRRLIEKYPNPQNLPESMFISQYVGEWTNEVKQGMLGKSFAFGYVSYSNL